jgi:hypothetical protein
MKKTLLTGIAALFLATGTAHAVEIPKQYRGVWCHTRWDTIYERCSDPDQGLEIKKTSWVTGELYGGITCTLSTIRKSKYGGYTLSGLCRSDEIGEVEGEEHWWLGSNNTRLQVITKDFCSTIGRGKCE